MMTKGKTRRASLGGTSQLTLRIDTELIGFLDTVAENLNFTRSGAINELIYLCRKFNDITQGRNKPSETVIQRANPGELEEIRALLSKLLYAYNNGRTIDMDLEKKIRAAILGKRVRKSN